MLSYRLGTVNNFQWGLKPGLSCNKYHTFLEKKKKNVPLLSLLPDQLEYKKNDSENWSEKSATTRPRAWIFLYNAFRGTLPICANYAPVAKMAHTKNRHLEQHEKRRTRRHNWHSELTVS